MSSVRAAILHTYDAPPRHGEFAEPQATEAHAVVDVVAAGVNHVDLLKASGRFYTGPPPLPSVVGSDGVGRLPDGRRVFFDSIVAPYGSMAERPRSRRRADRRPRRHRGRRRGRLRER